MQHQALLTLAAGRGWRQLRQRQTAYAASVAAPEQRQAAEAGSGTAAAQSADTAAAQYVVINFYHLADVPDAQEVREC